MRDCDAIGAISNITILPQFSRAMTIHAFVYLFCLYRTCGSSTCYIISHIFCVNLSLQQTS